MNELMQFEGNSVRILVEDGEPLFCAADVCGVLDIGDVGSAVSRLDEDEKAKKIQPRFQTGGVVAPQEAWFVTESGLYRLLLGSRKPEAKRFQRWVTHEVVPSIRKTGTFAAPETFEQQVVRLMGEAQRRIEEQQKQLAAAAPKVDFFDRLADATGLVCLQGAGKALGLPPNLWIRWLREQGHVFTRDRSTYARQDHVEAERMKHRVRVIDGREYTQAMVTPRGLAYFGERRPDLRPARRAPLPKLHGAPLALALPGSRA